MGKNISSFALLLVVAVAFAFILRSGVSKAERVECYQWKAQAQQFAGFYLTEWQKAQCEALSIHIK